MLTRTAVGILSAALALAIPQTTLAQSALPERSQPPTDAEIHERGLRLLANQHRNDDAVDLYERVEHQVETTGGANPRTIEDRTIRVVPNGAGTNKLLLKDGDQPVTPAEYQRELRVWLDTLQMLIDPGDERAKSALVKYNKRKQERAHLVDALLQAYIPKWAGMEMRNGRDCDVFTLSPDPNFHPHSIFEEILPHASVKIWVDHNADQLLRAEALITSDFSLGGGILGKLYKGGTFVMEQTEEAPGFWFPTRYQFDYSGRRFLFSFESHQSIEASHYRYIGTTKDALAVVQRELADGKPLAGDP